MFKLSAILFAFILFQITLADQVKVDVYFEALCPDSKDFIVRQLMPLYDKPDFKDRLDVNLIPFGKASFKEDENGDLKFECQHRVNECISNMYLSCSLKMYSTEQSLRYTNCIMSKDKPHEHLETCANSLSLNYGDLKACFEDKSRGPQYLKKNGEKTFAFVAPRTALLFVPTVVLNNKYEKKETQEILEHFEDAVCSRLQDKPKSCKP